MKIKNINSIIARLKLKLVPLKIAFKINKDMNSKEAKLERKIVSNFEAKHNLCSQFENFTITESCRYLGSYIFELTVITENNTTGSKTTEIYETDHLGNIISYEKLTYQKRI